MPLPPTYSSPTYRSFGLVDLEPAPNNSNKRGIRRLNPILNGLINMMNEILAGDNSSNASGEARRDFLRCAGLIFYRLRPVLAPAIVIRSIVGIGLLCASASEIMHVRFYIEDLVT